MKVRGVSLGTWEYVRQNKPEFTWGSSLFFWGGELSSIISICRPPTSGGNFLCGNAFQMEMTWHHSFLTLEHVFLFKSEIYLSTFIPCKYHLGLTTDFSFDLGTFWTISIIVYEWWFCKLYQIACFQGDKGMHIFSNCPSDLKPNGTQSKK